MLVLLPKVAIGYNIGFREKNNQILKKNKEKKNFTKSFSELLEHIIFKKYFFSGRNFGL